MFDSLTFQLYLLLEAEKTISLLSKNLKVSHDPTQDAMHVGESSERHLLAK